MWFYRIQFFEYHERQIPTNQLINVDKLDYCSNVENVNPGVATLVKGDVGNRELIEHLIQIYSFDAVFHFAAQSHVDNSFNDAIL